MLRWERFEGPRDPRLTDLLLIGNNGGGGGGGGIANAFDLVQHVVNADAAVSPSATKNVTVVLSGLAANHVLTMPAAPIVGQRFTFVDGDGSLGSGFNWLISGNFNTMNGLNTFALSAATMGPAGDGTPGGGIGPRGAITFLYDGVEYKVVS